MASGNAHDGMLNVFLELFLAENPIISEIRARVKLQVIIKHQMHKSHEPKDVLTKINYPTNPFEENHVHVKQMLSAFTQMSQKSNFNPNKRSRPSNHQQVLSKVGSLSPSGTNTGLNPFHSLHQRHARNNSTERYVCVC